MRSPTLTTIRMVEQTLMKHCDIPMKLSELKRRLPRKVMHQTLVAIIDYLQESNKIIIGTKGIQWIYTEPEQFKRMMEGSVEVRPAKRAGKRALPKIDRSIAPSVN